MNAPVITVDGPTASGKGTVAQGVARRLGFHYLDSGALYRLVAFAAQNARLALDDGVALAHLASGLEMRFADGRVWFGEREVSDHIRAEEVGNGASKIAVLPALRAALLARQRDFRQAPGLVTDGRDMGSVVFPDASLKIFLTADVQKRAERRTKQLMDKGISVNITTLLQDLRERDARDSERASAPLRAAADALLIDSSDLSPQAVVDLIVQQYLSTR